MKINYAAERIANNVIESKNSSWCEAKNRLGFRQKSPILQCSNNAESNDN